MIRAIGIQKFLVLVILASVFIVVGLYNFYVLMPDSKRVLGELNKYRAELSEIQTNMDNLVQGLEKFKEQEGKFAVIQKFGFFDAQNRVQTTQRFNAMQKETRLVSAQYAIKPAQTEKNEKAQEAGYKIVSTDIDLSLEAFEDGDIYNFLYLLNYGFPGQVNINDIEITRDVEITQPLLRQIGVGEADGLVTATVNVNWRTMLPDDSLAISGKVEGEQ